MANETVLFKRGDSATITSTPVTDGQILFDTSGNGKMYLDNGTDRLEMGGAITVDASLSNTSTNAIQNKAVTGNILNSLAEVSAATQQNTIAGALALKEVNSSLSDKVNGFTSDTYEAVTGLAYDATNNKLGLKVGADTVIPFSSGVSEFAFFIMHLSSGANDGFIYCNDTFNSLCNNASTIISDEYIGERIKYSRINSQQAGFYAVTDGKYSRKDQTHEFETIEAKAGDLLGTSTNSNYEIIVIAL